MLEISMAKERRQSSKPIILTYHQEKIKILLSALTSETTCCSHILLSKYINFWVTLDCYQSSARLLPLHDRKFSIYVTVTQNRGNKSVETIFCGTLLLIFLKSDF